jgi:hypothetical protein
MYHENENGIPVENAAPVQEDPVQLDLFSLPSPSSNREISRIMVFFSDKTFQEFRQSD